MVGTDQEQWKGRKGKERERTARKRNKKRFGRISTRTLDKCDVLFVAVALLQSLDDGAELLHGVGGVDLTADTHDTHQATTANG